MADEKCTTQSCSSCGEDCGDRTAPQDLIAPVNAHSKVKKVIGVVSGKGGVGKSMVTSMLAIASSKAGLKTAILDADVTGPSIPKAFGIKDRVRASMQGILPAQTKLGINVMSVNLLLEKDTDPVVWRGPVIGNTVKQFWTDIVWGDIDFMFIDMPPGTGDVALTVFQSLPVDGIIIVTAPQELVSMIVAKAVNMAKMMDVPIIGLVENMSYFHCPDNGKDYKIFGESHIDDTAKEYDLRVLAKLPINPEIAQAVDRGDVESCDDTQFTPIVEMLKTLDNKKV